MRALYRWRAPDSPLPPTSTGNDPWLVLIPGPLADVELTFGPLLQGAHERIGAAYEDRVLAFAHSGLDETPAAQALQLARALPAHAVLHLVSHSSGGVIADLLCVHDLMAALHEHRLDPRCIAAADESERARRAAEFSMETEAEHARLRELAEVLDRQRLRITRHVRVASPSRGWRLAADGQHAVFAALRRSLRQPAIAQQPTLGITSLLPGSPLQRLLSRTKVVDTVHLLVVTGISPREQVPGDGVVDADTARGGPLPAERTQVFVDLADDVDHHAYFRHAAVCSATLAWLLDPPTSRPAPAAQKTRTRERQRPTVVLLPGIMASHLWQHRRDRLWLAFAAIASGKLAALRLPDDGSDDGIEAESLVESSYAALQAHLQSSHDVIAHPYDWRQPVDVCADALALILRKRLDANKRPIRLLAHSMGGLVVRSLIHRHAALWDELMHREGARFVMLGTPNQGSHAMVETLLGKSDTLRQLGMLDPALGLQALVDIVATFPGALQLLPKPGFLDAGQLTNTIIDWFRSDIWASISRQMQDAWFGHGIGARPLQRTLERARGLWAVDGAGVPSLPLRHAERVAYVFGCAPRTPCGLERHGDTWRLLGTPHGDGSVTWASGAIAGIGSHWWMPALHTALAAAPAYFDSLVELLEHGTGGRLATSPPTLRDETAPLVAPYEAGPPFHPTELDVVTGFSGLPLPDAAPTRAALTVRVKAMDLRDVKQPLLVGHYEQDAISGPEALIDHHLVDGELSRRHQLEHYPGALDTALAVFPAATKADHARGSHRGAVVVGLGPYDGSLSVSRLTQAVRTGALTLLRQSQTQDSAQGITLCSLLLGYNSSANLGIADSVQALIDGVMQANEQWSKSNDSSKRISAVEIVELYLDTAISAVYALRDIVMARSDGAVSADPVLREGSGARQRLRDVSIATYWPRLMITDEPAQDGSSRQLRFLYLGPRARAEAAVSARQAGRVEEMVERGIAQRRHDAAFSRTLFEALVPGAFKDVARHASQMVFVLDPFTANLPWELMLVDDTPLAARFAMVRQLATPTFRPSIRQAWQRRAYVIGNPSTTGADKALAGMTGSSLEDLPGAEREARSVVAVLRERGFDVGEAIGRHHRVADVIDGLTEQSWRIVHVAGHGAYAMPGIDGQARSGVVLSDGRLITAIEIAAMHDVPELVFLNCCHLGRIDTVRVPLHRLAASVARELIDIGVRAVVVAGWAVDDEPASLFAQVFYQHLVGDNARFGDAVFAARRAVWTHDPQGMTWGAYQAYGDPGWRVDTATASSPMPLMTEAFDGVAPQELLERITGERDALRRRNAPLSEQDAQAVHARLQSWWQRMPSTWAALPELHAARADLYADLGTAWIAEARASYAQALRSGDDTHVALRAVEQLATLDARIGQHTDDRTLVADAIERLAALVRSTAYAHPKRTSLLGSAWKRMAALHARRYLIDRVEALEPCLAALVQAAQCYRSVSFNAGRLQPYPMLNALFLSIILDDADPQAALHARECAKLANASFNDEPNGWNATMVAEAALVRALIEHTADLSDVTLAFESAMANAQLSPKQRDTVLGHLAWLALMFAARGTQTADSVARERYRMLTGLLIRLGGIPLTPNSGGAANV